MKIYNGTLLFPPVYQLSKDLLVGVNKKIDKMAVEISKIMKVMTDCLPTVNLTKGTTNEVERFTYLGSVATRKGTEQDVERLGEGRIFFCFRAMDKL